MADQTLRLQLEESVIQAGRQIHYAYDKFDWITSDEMQHLLNAWHGLVDYYVHHPDDTVISVEVLAEYLDPTRLLRKLLSWEEIDTALKEQMEDLLLEFEGILDEIRIEVVSFLSSQDHNRFIPSGASS